MDLADIFVVAFPGAFVFVVDLPDASIDEFVDLAGSLDEEIGRLSVALETANIVADSLDETLDQVCRNELIARDVGQFRI